MHILLAGGSGFIGKALIKELRKAGHSLVLLSRFPDKIQSSPSVRIVQWDAQSAGSWTTHLENCDAVINLTGEGIAERRWTKSQKKVLLQSRINSTRALVLAVSQAPKKLRTFINASAIGFYGNVPDGNVTEKSVKGIGFLADICGQWEREALQAQTLGLRVVLLRIGIVLEKDGGALGKMLLPFRLGLGGPLGDGKQWMSWIHRTDLIQSIMKCLTDASLDGVVNATAPFPVTMSEFASCLGKALRRPAFFSVPAFLLRFLLGEMSALFLEGQKVIPTKLIRSDFHFTHPTLSEAFRDILKT